MAGLNLEQIKTMVDVKVIPSIYFESSNACTLHTHTQPEILHMFYYQFNRIELNFNLQLLNLLPIADCRFDSLIGKKKCGGNVRKSVKRKWKRSDYAHEHTKKIDKEFLVCFALLSIKISFNSLTASLSLSPVI